MRRISRVIFLALCFILLVGASSSTMSVESLEVTQRADVTLYFNGGPVDLKDDLGILSRPICYDGVTYVTSTGLSSIAGQHIFYDKERNSVILTSTEVEQVESLITYTYQEGDKPTGSTGGYSRSNQVTAKSHKEVAVVDERGGDKVKVETTSMLMVDDQYYLPVRLLEKYFGMVIEWNSYLTGVDIFTESFYNTVEAMRNNTSTRIPFTDSVYAIRYWAMSNIFKDSSRAFRFSVSTGAGGVQYISWPGMRVGLALSQSQANQNIIAAMVASLNLEGKTSREKADAIARYIIDTYEYLQADADAKDSIYPRTLQAILSSDKQICEGYSRLFKEMCLDAGLNAQYILGSVPTGNNKVMSHAWSRVFVDGEWLYYDLTFADTSDEPAKWCGLTEDAIRSMRQEYGVRIGF